MEKLKYKSEDKEFPPTFWTPISEQDKVILSAQNKGRKFSLSYVVAVAKRCPNGFPQVVVCRPFSFDGKPFPTIFWLTCPYLDYKCGKLESNQKVKELEAMFRLNPLKVEKWHKLYKSLRKKLIDKKTEESLKTVSSSMINQILTKGVGGIDSNEAPFGVKCLHLQVATWLGMRNHPAKQWLSTQIGIMECANRRCNSYLLNGENN